MSGALSSDWVSPSAWAATLCGSSKHHHGKSGAEDVALVEKRKEGDKDGEYGFLAVEELRAEIRGLRSQLEAGKDARALSNEKLAQHSSLKKAVGALVPTVGEALRRDAGLQTEQILRLVHLHLNELRERKKASMATAVERSKDGGEQAGGQEEEPELLPGSPAWRWQQVAELRGNELEALKIELSDLFAQVAAAQDALVRSKEQAESATSRITMAEAEAAAATDRCAKAEDLLEQQARQLVTSQHSAAELSGMRKAGERAASELDAVRAQLSEVLARETAAVEYGAKLTQQVETERATHSREVAAVRAEARDIGSAVSTELAAAVRSPR